ncbi:hypothetical protein BGY98DRAFT_934564 [Russula aff. rugulosa BPL654]|nr:hypothetical protein BGY98DRAFT_934564 [Russula aff. rugulosa BPL654]
MSVYYGRTHGALHYPHTMLQTRDDALQTYIPQGWPYAFYSSQANPGPVVVEPALPAPVSRSATYQVPTSARFPNTAPVPNAARWEVPTMPQDPTAAQVPTAAQEALNNDSEMWNLYLDEVKEEDTRITDAWKEDANSILVFTGLLSAIIGAFIIEFYKKLSTDSGNQTVALLQQISQQLPNSPNTTDSNLTNQLSPPASGAAIVWVNILWLISLVLSLTCALIATLLQQWARRYVETPKSSGVVRYRARVRTLLLAGVKLYKIPLIAEMLPTLLHLSVFLFFGGLMIAFHTIHKKVAIAVDVAVGLLGLAYIVMSILPCLDVSCPYRTPISQMLWYPCHAFLSFATLCLHICVRGLQGLLTTRSRFCHVDNFGWRHVDPPLIGGIHIWLREEHRPRAIEVLKDGDSRRVTSLFTQLALGDRSRFLNFAASIPRQRIPDLILPTELNSLPLVPLLVLLRSCLAGTYSQANETYTHGPS